MAEEDVNKYRLTSMEEPSDEMLSFIMREVADDVERSNNEPLRRYFDEISDMYENKYGKQ